MTTILGISAFYHDSAAALIKDGAIVSAAQEEIMDDPEIAEAIIGEMSKIFKVQPDHQQKIIRFYEECAGNGKLPENIRNLCDKERYSTGN